MKKLFVIVLAAIGMVSCMNTDEVIEVNNGNAIAFADAFIENSVRAEINTGNLTTLNVWGWMQEDAVTATVFEGKEVTNTDGAGWTYSPAQYWVPGFTYNFQALSSNLAKADRKWTVTAADGKVSVVTFENVNGTEDLIYATAANVKAPELGTTAQPVSLVFNHQLAKVKFTFTYDAQLSKALGNGLSVKAENIKMVVPKKGKIDYSETTPTWELVGAATKERVFAAAGDELLTIPAENYTYAISFDVNLYKDGAKVKTLVNKTASVVLDVVKGCAYNFTATLTPENLQMDSIDFTPEVNPWNPNGNAGFTPDATMAQVAEGVFTDPAGVYYILNAAGWNWMEAQTDAFFKGKTVALGKDIDFNGATITPIRFWNPENRTTFDGQNFTVKNFVINGGNNSSIALFNGTLKVENLKIDNATVSGNGYVAVVGGTIYGNINNVHITNSIVTGTYWQVGGFAGQFNSGTITNCSIKNTTITGPSAVGALAGITNEKPNERKFENCVVEDCTIEQNGSFGGDCDKWYGVATGLINFDNGSVYFTNVTMTNNTIKGAASSVLYGECEASTTVYVDGLLPVASGLGLNAEGAYVVTTGQGFKTVATTVLADGTKNVTIEMAKDIDLAGIEWPAVCTNAAFELDGKGYAIKNLTTSAVEEHGFYSTAMFTSTRKATTIKNLVVENATVTGKGGDNSHGAVLVACNYSDLNIEGVTVKNSTINNCDRTGGLVTYLYTDGVAVKNCIVEGCTINSIGTAGAILGMNDGHNFEMKGCQVVNTTVSSSEGNNKAGILIGTWQDAGTLTKENNTIENSKAINAGVETNNEIGRHA